MQIVIECADRHGGALSASDVADEGEKLIVLFGAPIAHEGEEASALRFALDLSEELTEAALHLKHRVGIASGFVYAGEVGFERRREYTVIGDVVNLSARLMARAKWGEVIVSDRTAARAGSAFELRRLRPVRVKGKSAPVRAFRLEGRSRDPATSSDSTPILGREKELARLMRLARRSEEGRSGWVHIGGEAGIGKSRLVAELATQLTARGWQHIAAACHAYTAQAPFAPWLPALRALLGVAGTNSDAEAWQRLQDPCRPGDHAGIDGPRAAARGTPAHFHRGRCGNAAGRRQGATAAAFPPGRADLPRVCGGTTARSDDGRPTLVRFPLAGASSRSPASRAQDDFLSASAHDLPSLRRKSRNSGTGPF